MKIAVWLATVVSVFFANSVGSSEDLTLTAYKERLGNIRQLLKSDQLPQARREAQTLLHVRIRYGVEWISPDGTVLLPITNIQSSENIQQLCDRLDTLRSDLGQPLKASGEQIHPPDSDLLEEIRKDQAVNNPHSGGEVGDLPDPHLSLPNWVLKGLSDILTGIGNRLSSGIKWLWDFFSGSSKDKSQPFWEGVWPFAVTIVIALFGIIVLLVWDIIKKNRMRLQAAQAAPIAAQPSSEDSDPTSRVSDEWERLARDLVGKGKYREALRAWYHALLGSLFQAGVLHYRKGRTNWEYCNDLSPEHGWRPQFMEVTRIFEYRWYGRVPTSNEELHVFADQVIRIRTTINKGGVA